MATTIAQEQKNMPSRSGGINNLQSLAESSQPTTPGAQSDVLPAPGTVAPQAKRGRRWWWVWLLLPLLAFLLGSWWLYQSLIARNLNFETKSVVTSGAAVVESVMKVNKQVFVEYYDVVDINYREAPKNWLQYFGVEQSFVLLLRGRVPAGFDLGALTEQDVWISNDGKRAQLTLPPPTVFEENVAIDFARSRIISQTDTCPDQICENDVAAYQNQLLPEGRELLIDSAVESGILHDAAADGKAYYEELLRMLGFEEVRVVVEGY